MTVVRRVGLTFFRRIHMSEFSTALILQIFSSVTAIKLLMLEVPSPTILGENVELTCSFDLQKDNLYSIKWYKNNIEFYRFVPKDWPPGQYLPLPGVRVDLTRSGQRSVYLKHVDLNSAGVYRCEISAEAPSFQTVNAHKEMAVLVLPTEGPKITGGLPRYHIGDTVSLNCTSSKSKPAASLKWYINEEVAGPGYETEYSTTLHADGLETSSLGLRFIVQGDHFSHGNMRLRCTATISRLYSMSNEEELIHGDRQQNSGLQISENVSPVRSTAAKATSPVRWAVVCLLVSALSSIAHW